MVDNTGKDSDFNWAALFIQDLDRLSVRFGELSLNLLKYDIEFNKYHFELAAQTLETFFSKLSGHLSPEEKKKGLRYVEGISCVLGLGIFEVTSVSTLSGTKTNLRLKPENYQFLRKLLFNFNLQLNDWIEVHKLGTPTKKDVNKSAVDM